MPEFQQTVDILVATILILSLIPTWAMDISLESHFVPTIINGISSSISLIVGFTATAIAITVSRPLFKHSQDTKRIIYTIIFLIPAIASLFLAYNELMRAEFQLALKYGMTGLSISFVILFDFLAFLCSRLETMGED